MEIGQESLSSSAAPVQRDVAPAEETPLSVTEGSSSIQPAPDTPPPEPVVDRPVTVPFPDWSKLPKELTAKTERAPLWPTVDRPAPETTPDASSLRTPGEKASVRKAEKQERLKVSIAERRRRKVARGIAKPDLGDAIQMQALQTNAQQREQLMFHSQRQSVKRGAATDDASEELWGMQIGFDKRAQQDLENIRSQLHMIVSAFEHTTNTLTDTNVF